MLSGAAGRQENDQTSQRNNVRFGPSLIVPYCWKMLMVPMYIIAFLYLVIYRPSLAGLSSDAKSFGTSGEVRTT